MSLIKDTFILLIVSDLLYWYIERLNIDVKTEIGFIVGDNITYVII